MTPDEIAADAFLQKTIRELRTENNQLKNEMMSREIERLTGDRFEFHGELGDKVPALTKDEASLLVLRGALYAATTEVGKLRAENERQKVALQSCLDKWNEQLFPEMEQLRAENERLCLQREGLLSRVAELRAEIELVSK